MITSQPTRSDTRRAEALAVTPRWYSPVLHLMGTAGTGVCASVLAVSQMRDLGWLETVSTLVAALLFANFFEWWVHKNVMHRPRRRLRHTYEDHTRRHHAIYTEHRMEMRERAEWRFVLIGAKDYVGLMAVTATVSLALGFAVSANVGWLSLCTQALYVSTYEVTHLAYHLPADNMLRRLPLFDKILSHHARHHDLALMGKYNFNITFPLADLVLGTMAPRPVCEKT